MQRRDGEEQGNAPAAEDPTEEVETPAAQDLPPSHIGVDSPSSALQELEPLPLFQNYPDTSTEAPTVSSPTLSVSTISDLSPTEFDEDTGEASGEQVPARHEMFYSEDGNVEIVCGHTVFRVHSTAVTFSSPNLRDALSSSALRNAPMPEGCPRVFFKDNAEDFAVLLKMIYTPGWVFSSRSIF